MDSIFKVCKSGPCSITVTGLEKDNDEYLTGEEIIVSTRNYSYEQTVTINVLTSITSQGEETVQGQDIVKHEIDCIDESEFTMPIDGLYEIIHIILPNNTWLDYVLERDESALDAYNLIYYYDLTTETFKKYQDGQSIDVELDEILQVNATPPSDIIEKTTTIIRSEKNTFGLCYINECFYNICKSLLTVLPRLCLNKQEEYKLLIQNRDILWMALNVIKYLLELKQYYEAQRILEEVIQCGGICKNNGISNIKGESNCGCAN